MNPATTNVTRVNAARMAKGRSSRTPAQSPCLRARRQLRRLGRLGLREVRGERSITGSSPTWEPGVTGRGRGRLQANASSTVASSTASTVGCGTAAVRFRRRCRTTRAWTSVDRRKRPGPSRNSWTSPSASIDSSSSTVAHSLLAASSSVQNVRAITAHSISGNDKQHGHSQAAKSIDGHLETQRPPCRTTTIVENLGSFDGCHHSFWSGGPKTPRGHPAGRRSRRRP